MWKFTEISLKNTEGTNASIGLEREASELAQIVDIIRYKLRAKSNILRKGDEKKRKESLYFDEELPELQNGSKR